MSEDSLAFSKLTIRRAPGFDGGGFTIDDLSASVNVIHGPNASGKSTVAESIQAVLWPTNAPRNSSLVGQFDTGDDQWRVDVAGQQATYQRDGRDANPPNLPPAHEAPRYHLPLHELLQHQTTNQSFAEQIQQASRGGFDLNAAHDRLDYSDTPSTRNISEYQAYATARSDRREAEEQNADLEREQGRLPELNAKKQKAEEAKTRLQVLEQAIAYADAREELEAARAEVNEYPEILADVSGEEIDRVQEYTDQLETLREKLNDAEEDKAEATDKIADTELSDVDLQDGLIDGLEQRLDTIDRLEQKEAQLDRQRSEARNRRQQARDEIPLDVTDEVLAEFDPTAWRDVVGFVEEVEEVRSKRRTIDAVNELLEPADEIEVDQSTLEKGRQSLEEWLATPASQQGADGHAVFRIATISAVLLAAASLALGLLVNPLFFAGLAIAGGLFVYGYRALSEVASTADPRDTYEASFKRLAIDPPTNWTQEQVRDRLTELYEQLATATLNAKLQSYLDNLTAEQTSLAADEDQLEAKRQELIERYGLAPEVSDPELTATVRGVLHWQDANDDLVAVEERLAALSSQIEEAYTELAAALEPFDYEAVSEVPAATQQIRNLESRIRTYEDARRQVERAEGMIDSISDDIDVVQEKRRAVYEDLDLEPGSVAELERLCEQVAKYEGAVQTVRTKQEVLAREEKELENTPGFDPAVKEQSVKELRAEKDEIEEVANTLEDVRKSINEIETKISEAKKRFEIENAVAEERRALDALEEKYEADVRALVGDVLVDHVREVSAETGRPEVFSRAQNILRTITRGRYELDLVEEEFRAYDTVKERGLGLDELSSGTRLQVLLAVRIAFVQEQERGYALPLILDETLANTDDTRATVLIESMIALAREGRQIFYFTAQGDEVARWQQALEESGEIESEVIDLAAHVDAAERIEIPDGVDPTPLTSSAPEPAGMSHAEYGEKLGVPRFSPRAGAGAAHVWYIVEDTDLLHHLLEMGIDRWGQLKTILQQPSGDRITDDPDVRDRILRNGAALEEYVQSWEVGRGNQIDRQVLEDSGAVSENFIVQVSRFAREVDGDAEAIIAGLRDGKVNRFRSQKVEELEAYFEEHGYIQDRETLEPETIIGRVVTTLTSEGMSQAAARDQAYALFRRLRDTQQTPNAES